MKYISTLLAGLLVIGSLSVLPLYREGSKGGEFSRPPVVEDETVLLADEGGGDGVQGKPSPEEARSVVLV
jgi:hypothetical protein